MIYLKYNIIKIEDLYVRETIKISLNTIYCASISISDHECIAILSERSGIPSTVVSFFGSIAFLESIRQFFNGFISIGDDGLLLISLFRKFFCFFGKGVNLRFKNFYVFFSPVKNFDEPFLIFHGTIANI